MFRLQHVIIITRALGFRCRSVVIWTPRRPVQSGGRNGFRMYRQRERGSLSKIKYTYFFFSPGIFSISIRPDRRPRDSRRSSENGFRTVPDPITDSRGSSLGAETRSSSSNFYRDRRAREARALHISK